MSFIPHASLHHQLCSVPDMAGTHHFYLDMELGQMALGNGQRKRFEDIIGRTSRSQKEHVRRAKNHQRRRRKKKKEDWGK